MPDHPKSRTFEPHVWPGLRWSKAPAAMALVALALLAWPQDWPAPTLIPNALAQEALPAVWQRKVQKLLDNMENSSRYFAESGAQDMQDPFKAKQWRDRIDNYATSLSRVPASSDPLLAQAKAQLTELQQALNEVPAGAPGAATTTPTDATPKQQVAPQQASPPPASAPRLVSGQRVQVKKLARDITNTRNDMVTSGPSPLQDPSLVEGYSKRLKIFGDGLARYSDFGHEPEVQQARTAYDNLLSALAAEQERARQQVAAVGNAQEILTDLRQNLRDNPAPTLLYPPFGQEEARQWVQLAASAQQASTAAATEIQRITPLAYLPETRGTPEQGAAYDRRDMESMFRSANDTTRKVTETLNATQSNLDQQFQHQNGEHQLGYFRKLDPDNPQHRANAFLSEGAQEEIYGRLDRHLALANSVAFFQLALGQQPAPNVQARITEIGELRKQYAANRLRALGDSRLPEAKANDSARLAVAKEILANPKYEFGQHGPIVLTTPKILTKEKEVSRDTIKDVDVSLSGTVTLSGTRETWQYKWEEFKFAAPLKEADSDDWYIWWITAKKFQSGWEKTPIGYWVSGGAVKGDLILEKNF